MNLLDFADALVHPSRSEGDSLIDIEAAWARNLLVLNYDLGPHRHQWEGLAVFGKFSSNMSITDGLGGETDTQYRDRANYMAGVAATVAHRLRADPALALHRKVRDERSLPHVWRRHLWPLIEGEW